MGSGYPGGLYPAQYSQGGTVPPDVFASAQTIVLCLSDQVTVRVPDDAIVVEVPLDLEVLS